MKGLNHASEQVHILIAEDSATQAVQLRHVLERHGFSVSTAANGREALKAMALETPRIVISDVIMPEMDGFTLCREIKDNDGWHGIPVVLLTSLTNTEDIIRGLQAGADNFIAKPYSEEYLLKRIDNILANMKLYRPEAVKDAVEVQFGQEKHLISAERQPMVNFLLSTYETAVQKNLALERTQDELRDLNEQLEERVEERTAELMQEIAERKAAQEKLVRLASFPSLAPDPIIEVSFSGEITFMNPAAEARFPELKEAGHQHPVLHGVIACIPPLRDEGRPSVLYDISVNGAIYEANVWNVQDADLIRVYLVDVTDRKMREEALKEKDREIRRTYVEVFSAVTGGRLIIMSREELEASLGEPVSPHIQVASGTDLVNARDQLRVFLRDLLPEHESVDDVVLAINEATTNTIKHAGHGEVSLYRSGDVIQIMITDAGPGIDFSILPKATLLAGFSTKPSLGMGFSIMLEMAERVILSTEAGYTGIVLEATDHPIEDEIGIHLGEWEDVI